MTGDRFPTSTVTDVVRVTDLDFQRHMGNTAFTDLFANARFAYLNDVVRPAVGFDDAVIVLVHVEVDFKAQVRYPSTVHTTTQVTDVGRTSLRLSQTMTSSEKVVATSASVLVLTDRTTGATTPWPESIAAVRA